MIHLFSILAVCGVVAAVNGDGGAGDISVAQWVYNTLLGIAMVWVGNKTRKVDALEEKNEEKTRALVAAQFEIHAARLAVQMATLTEKLNNVTHRLERGDNSFDALGDRDQQLELKLLARVDQVKDFVRDSIDGRFRELNARFEALQLAVARSMAEQLAANATNGTGGGRKGA